MSDSRDKHLDLVHSVRNLKHNFLYQGKILSELRKNSTYKETTGGIDSWHDYLAQPEIGMSPTQANKLLNIYEFFIKDMFFEEDEIIKIPVKILNYLVKRKEEIKDLERATIEEIVSQAQVLTFKDFKEAYFDQRSEAAEKLGEDKGQRTFSYILMQKCNETGNLSKVHKYSSDDIDTMMMRFEDQDN